MNLDAAIRLTDILLGFALLQQSAEHLATATTAAKLFLLRLALSVLLMFGIAPLWVCIALLGLGISILQRFHGPYNGGSDRMGLLILCCLCVAHATPSVRWQETMFGYIAVQLVLSYAVAGWVKLVNPEWRTGRALADVFLFSAYPVSESLRTIANRPRLLCVMSWAVMLFEILFPLALLTPTTLIIALLIAACFHLANACLFGLNRFFWVWVAAYPSLLWLQHRIVF